MTFTATTVPSLRKACEQTPRQHETDAMSTIKDAAESKSSAIRTYRYETMDERAAATRVEPSDALSGW